VPRHKTESATFSTNDDIRLIIPKVEDYCSPFFGDNPAQIKEHITRCRVEANKWVKNQIERALVNTFAQDNDKALMEANYAAYLILKGTVRGQAGENNGWVNGYLNDAKDILEELRKFKTAAAGLASRTVRFTKKRWMHQDFQRPDQVKKVPK